MATASEDRKTIELNELPADEAKKSFGELIARAGFGGERFVITRHGKPLAAIVSLKDLEALDHAG